MKETDKIKVPRRAGNSSRIDKALTKVPRDGEWHKMLEMGFTSAEQTARGLNCGEQYWEFGYTHDTKDGEMISVLWGRWTNDD